MKDVLYLAWRYLTYHRVKTIILVATIALIVYLPVGLNVLVGQSANELTSRAADTPFLVGARSSPLELVLSSLYFDADTPELTTYAEAERIAASGLADPIPLYARFRARDQPIVGTTLDYFEFRGLRLASGRAMAVLGECVLGAEAAKRLGVGAGGAVVSSPETVFDLAGVYPLRMQVTGVLERSFTPDDQAIFVDIKTAWIIQGLVHGHQDLAAPEAAAAVLDRDENKITANASVVQYTEINTENIDSFHFHGDRADYPISAVIAVPHDQKSGVLLMGRYESEGEAARIVRPRVIIDDLLGTVFTVQGFVVAALGLVALATLATAALVFLLSLRLRRREIETIVKIGGSRLSVGALFASETVTVLIVGGFLAATLTLLTSLFGASAIRAFLVG
jgi:putative ABC transport system permease protein